MAAIENSPNSCCVPLVFFFFLKNSPHSSPLLQTSVLPLTQPNSPTRPGTDWVRVHHCPTLPSRCPVSVGTHSPCVFATLSLFSTLWFQASRSLLVLLKPCLAGEGAIDLVLSQESCGRPCGHWAWGYSHPGPCAGPRDLIVLKHSPNCLIFQCPLQFLVSNLHICWDTIGCSLCAPRRSARCFIRAQGEVDSAPTYLTAIFHKNRI